MDEGTPWAKANWAFYGRLARTLSLDAVVLDVGAGRGRFRQLFENTHYVAVDLFPYRSVDVVCDVVSDCPFAPASVDVVLLSNVLEHIYDAHSLLQALSIVVKPNGRLIIAVPFSIPVHQAPLDFQRYTQFGLARLLTEHQFEITSLEAVDAPLSFVRSAVAGLSKMLPPTTRWRRLGRRAAFFGLNWSIWLLKNIGLPAEPSVTRLPSENVGFKYTLGYQTIAAKRPHSL